MIMYIYIWLYVYIYIDSWIPLSFEPTLHNPNQWFHPLRNGFWGVFNKGNGITRIRVSTAKYVEGVEITNQVV